MQRPLMEFSGVVGSPVAHVLLIDISSQVKMSLITEKHKRVVRDVFKKCFTRISSSIKVAFRKFLHNGQLVRMEMKFIVQNSPHGTIGNSKSRRMFAHRTPRGSQNCNSYCFDVLRCSDGTCVSSFSFLHRTSFPECCDPQKN